MTPDGEVLDTQDDESLARRIKLGDRDAEDQLVRRYSGRVLAMAVVRMHDREAARELVDDVMMAVVMALRRGAVNDTARLGGFVYGTALNLVHNQRRAKYRTPPSEQYNDDAIGWDPAESIERDSDMQALRHDIARMQMRDRQVLYLTLVGGLKPGEIAKRLGLSTEAVRQQKGRALKRLREMMDGASQNAPREPRR